MARNCWSDFSPEPTASGFAASALVGFSARFRTGSCNFEQMYRGFIAALFEGILLSVIMGLDRRELARRDFLNTTKPPTYASNDIAIRFRMNRGEIRNIKNLIDVLIILLLLEVEISPASAGLVR